MTPYFLILALLLALAPAVIAHGKGRNFLLWWLYGVVLGPVALIHSILMRSLRRPARVDDPDRRESSWSSPWPLLLRVAASLAIAVVAVAIYRFFVPPEFDKVTDKREVSVSTDRTPPAQPSPPSSASDAAPAGTGDTAAQAPESGAAPAPNPSPAPNVNVTVRQDATAPDPAAPKEAAPKETDAPKEPVASKPSEPPAPPAPDSKQAVSDMASLPPPPPPPPSPAKSPGDTAERTTPLERTTAETPAPEPEKKPAAEEQPSVKDVDALAARTAPPEGARSASPDPVIAPPPREETLRREQDEQPSRRKPATRKAAAPKPAPAPAPAAPPPPAPSDVTAVGDTVRVVQQALAERGYDPGPANGRAGRQTEQAIRKFQEDRGLNPTGSIDYSVLETLNIVGPRVHAFQPPPGTAPGR